MIYPDGTKGTIKKGAYTGKHGTVVNSDYSVLLDDGVTKVGPFHTASGFQPDPIKIWGCNAISSYEDTGLGTGLSRAKSLGITWDRPYAENPTKISWWVDTVTRCNKIGISPLVCIERRPVGSDFVQVASQLVSALKPLGVKYYQILNEPDLAGITPATYAQLLKSTVTECRKVDSNAKFIGYSAPDMYIIPTGEVNGKWVQWPIECVKAVPDIAYYMDALAIHPYGSLSSTSHSWGGGWNLIKYERDLWIAAGVAKPFWITEVGMKIGSSDLATKGTETEQADRITQYINDVKNTSYVDAFFWFQWGNYGTDEQWGLTRDRNGAFRPAASRYQQLVAS